jgi:hypothetical protein
MSAITNDSIRQYFIQHLKDSEEKGINNIYIVFSNEVGRGVEGIVGVRADVTSICNTANNNESTGSTKALFALKLRSADPASGNKLNYALAASLATPGTDGTLINVQGINYLIKPDISTELEQLWNGLYANINITNQNQLSYNTITVVANLKETGTTNNATSDIVTNFSYNTESNDSFGDDTHIIMQSKPSPKVIQSDIQEFPILMLF